ncbi:putidacin L1 family lectin-like bacteriocin [Pseudomonas alabamensis]|uniref:putidacin L1 family lectin-like bacteriocin n=1 Tax=Pseudomonas alabamensis TaxID=3064349 RepID=UPI003F65102C
MSDKYKSIEDLAQPFTNSGGSFLPPLTKLAAGQCLRSPNGRYQLVFQSDDNVVLYDGAQAIWVANKDAAYSKEAFKNNWGKYEASKLYLAYNLILNDRTHNRTWQTTAADVPGGNNTGAFRRAFLQLQDDGNMVIADQTPLWSVGSSPVFKPDLLSVFIGPDTVIKPGDAFAVGNYQLVFQSDGNLVFYGENNKVVWASYTHGKGAAFVAMQGDGNLVVYTADGKALWQASTGGHPGAYVRIREDGTFSIINDRICWARFGFVPSIAPPQPKRKLVEHGPVNLPSIPFDLW